MLLGGVAVMPFRGWAMQQGYVTRMRAVRDEYNGLLGKAALEQIEHGRMMRTNAVAPFVRLVEASTTQSTRTAAELAAHQAGLDTLAAEINKMGGKK
jgi:hypothetical protein